jgi:Domain of unknown function (DUF2828)
MSSILNKIREELYKVSEIGVDEYENNKSVIEEFLENISLFRFAKEEDIIENYLKVFYYDSAYSLRLLFFIRDKINGLGEKRIFRILIKYLANEHTKYIKNNLTLIPKYGRWDDLYYLFDTNLEEDVVKLFKDQIEIDVNSKIPSTLGKWLKSENTSSKESIILGNKTRKLLGYSQKEYRKLLSSLRGKIGIVERDLSRKDYLNINYKNLTRLNIIKYKKAFIKRDKENFEKYIKRNVNSNFPFKNPENIVSDIIKNLNNLEINSTEDMYIKNWQYIIQEYKSCEDNIEDTLVINGIETEVLKRDSRYFEILITTILLYNKMNLNSFKNYYMSFKKNPKFNKVTGLNIVEDIKIILDSCINYNIDLSSALDLLLFTIVKKNFKNEEIPKSIIYIYSSSEDLDLNSYGKFNEKWLSLGLNTPKIKLWNLKSVSQKFSIRDIGNNNVIINGYDKRMWKYILKSKETTEYNINIDNFNDNNYKDVII